MVSVNCIAGIGPDKTHIDRHMITKVCLNVIQVVRNQQSCKVIKCVYYHYDNDNYLVATIDSRNFAYPLLKSSAHCELCFLLVVMFFPYLYGLRKRFTCSVVATIPIICGKVCNNLRALCACVGKTYCNVRRH
jgi:hypothetical protein